MAYIETVTDENFERIVLGADKPVLVDFWADWCGPCKAMEPALVDIAEEYEGEVHICKLDTVANQLMMERYAIRNIPAFLLFKDGQVIKTILGSRTRSSLASEIETGLRAQ